MGQHVESRDLAPVAAQALLRHGLHDHEVLGYVALTWALDDIDCHGGGGRRPRVVAPRGARRRVTAGGDVTKRLA